MSQEEKEVTRTEQSAAIPYELLSSIAADPIELAKELGDWFLGQPPEFRLQHKLVVDVKGRGIFLDVEKGTIEIRPVDSHLEIIPL